MGVLLAAHAALPSPLPHGAAGGEPPTPPGGGGTRLGLQNPRVTKAGAAGAMGRRWGHLLLMASPHQTCVCVCPPHPRHRERPEPRRETRTWLSPRPNLPPQPRSSLGGIRGDETSRKTHPHVLRGIYNNLLPGWTHGAAMSWAGGGGGSQIHRPQPCHRGRVVPPWNPLPRLQRGGTRSCWGDSTGSGSFPSSRATRSAQSSRRVLGGCSPAWRGGTAANRQLISAR